MEGSRSLTDSQPRVAAIVPAYNEQETLADVLTVLKRTPGIHEVIVVSDGSTDETVEIARALKVKAIHLRENRGKGTAMAVGVAHTDAPILLFVDGDILQLSDYLLEQLMTPVVSGASGMNVGVRHRGWLLNLFHRQFGPLLSGIRCLKREVFEAVPEEQLQGFAVETALNWSCRQLGKPLTTTVLFGLKHLVKEKKRGFANGARARYRMFESVFRAWLALKVKQPMLRRTGIPRRLEPGLEYINF